MVRFSCEQQREPVETSITSNIRGMSALNIFSEALLLSVT